MSNRSFSPSILSPLTLTRVRQPFNPPSILLYTGGPSSPNLTTARPSHFPPPPPTTKPFTTSPLALKKQGGKRASKNTVGINAAKTASDNADPTDFSALETQIATIEETLRAEVRNIRPGGVNIEAVEEAKVRLKVRDGTVGQGRRVLQGRVKGPMRVGGGGGPREIVKLKELCQVVLRGRMLILMVGEKEHIKPITMALAAAPLALTPVSSSSSPFSTTPSSATSSSSSQQSLEIHIPIPPTTGESRQAALHLVAGKGETALFALREARGVQKKRIRQLELSGKIGSEKARKA
ncbi:MAG: hypothetical protein LQ349_008845, partial [Xanthoria aureola]